MNRKFTHVHLKIDPDQTTEGQVADYPFIQTALDVPI